MSNSEWRSTLRTSLFESNHLWMNQSKMPHQPSMAECPSVYHHHDLPGFKQMSSLTRCYYRNIKMLELRLRHCNLSFKYKILFLLVDVVATDLLNLVISGNISMNCRVDSRISFFAERAIKPSDFSSFKNLRCSRWC